MPTLVRQNGFRVMIHTDDHPPAHVHCYRQGRAVKIGLETMTVISTRHASEQDIFDALQIVREHREWLLRGWSEFHGEAN